MTHSGIEELVQFAESAPGKNILAGNARKILLQEKKKASLPFVPRCEIRGATLRGSRTMALAVPIKDSFAEPGSRRDDGFVALRVRNALLQREEVAGRKFVQAARCSNKIVQEDNVLGGKIQGGSKRGGLHRPSQIEGVQASVHHGSRNTKACCADVRGSRRLLAQIFTELQEHFFEVRIVCGRIALSGNQPKFRAMFFKRGQVAFCAANVSRNDHWSPGNGSH